jgi:hypothetical protein
MGASGSTRRPAQKSASGTLTGNADKWSSRGRTEREAGPSEHAEFMEILFAVLQNPALIGSFRNYLAREHLAETLVLFWAEAETLRKCGALFFGQDSPPATLNLAATQSTRIAADAPGTTPTMGWKSCDLGCAHVDAPELLTAAGDLWHTYMSNGAYCCIGKWVDSMTRAESGDFLGIHKLGDRVQPRRAAHVAWAFVEAQSKACNAMLFDYLPGFIGSDYMRYARDRLILPSRFLELKSELRGACALGGTRNQCKTVPPPAPPQEHIDLVWEFLRDPCCAMYLRSFLRTDAKKSAAAAASMPYDMVDCLLEIQDFWGTKDEVRRLARGEVLVERYGGSLDTEEPLARLRRELLEKGASQVYCESKKFETALGITSRRLIARLFSGPLARFLLSATFTRLEEMMQNLSGGVRRMSPASGVGTTLKEDLVAPSAPRPCSLLKVIAPMCIQKKVDILEESALKFIPRPMLGAHLRGSREAKGGGQGHTHSPYGNSRKEGPPTTLDELLNDAYGRTLFKRFSARHLQEESISFLLEVRHYKNERYLAPPDGTVIYVTDIQKQMQSVRELRMTRARHLAEKYIGKDARCPINISDVMQKKIMDQVGGHPEEDGSTRAATLQLFDEAQGEILKLMTDNLWREFLQSPEWSALVSSLENRAHREAMSNFKPTRIGRLANTVSTILAMQKKSQTKSERFFLQQQEASEREVSQWQTQSNKERTERSTIENLEARTPRISVVREERLSLADLDATSMSAGKGGTEGSGEDATTP